MSRSMTAPALAELTAEASSDAMIALLTFTNADLTETIRLSNDPTTRLSSDPPVYGTQSRGNDYLYLPIDLTLPIDAEGRIPSAVLKIDNVDQQLVDLVRSIDTPASCKIELVYASDPDTVEIEWDEMVTREASYDATTVSLTISYEALMGQPFPDHDYGKYNFPGL